MDAPALSCPSPRRPRRTGGTLVAAIVLLAGCAAAHQQAVRLPDGTRGLRAVVTHVVDGDTVDLDISGSTERARLLGIDTPETVKPDAPVDCFGPEASARTKALLPSGTAVVIQRDREARDRYGRLLVYVWRQRDRLFINDALVRDGFARTLSIEPNTAHRADLAAAMAAARARSTGLWATCPPDG